MTGPCLCVTRRGWLEKGAWSQMRANIVVQAPDVRCRKLDVLQALVLSRHLYNAQVWCSPRKSRPRWQNVEGIGSYYAAGAVRPTLSVVPGARPTCGGPRFGAAFPLRRGGGRRRIKLLQFKRSRRKRTGGRQALKVPGCAPTKRARCRSPAGQVGPSQYGGARAGLRPTAALNQLSLGALAVRSCAFVHFTRVSAGGDALMLGEGTEACQRI